VVPLVTSDLLYEVPLLLEDAGLGDYIVRHFELETPQPDLSEWRQMIAGMRQLEKPVRVAIVGKYIELHDAYMSVKEALLHAASAQGRQLEIEWVYSGDLEKGRSGELLANVDGIVVPGGFGYRGVEGKVLAAKYARENEVPYLGLCLGMQAMCIDFARHVMGLDEANSTEFEINAPHPVISLMLEQRGITDMGGTMRLGRYTCEIQAGSLAAEAYGTNQIEERHRHRFEFNNEYRVRYQDAGMRFSGINPESNLVEIAELPGHPFMLGSQFHPEFTSRPNRPHALFRAFIRACESKRESQRMVNGVAAN